MVAAVRDHAGHVVAIHRTFLSADPIGKADMVAPRRALGPVLGYGVRLGGGPGCGAVVTGEGIETMLSIRAALPGLPAIAALSAGHLGALRLWPKLKRLYIASDRNAAGQQSARRLAAAARMTGVDVTILRPRGGDFNDDLLCNGVDVLRRRLEAQLVPEDAARALTGAGPMAASAERHGGQVPS